MRKIIYLLLLSMTTYIASSQTVNLGSAKKIAENYYHAYSKSPNKSNNVEATLLKSEINNNDTLYYIFNIGNEGFVIVSGEFTKSPVLGYSDEGTIDLNNMSPEFKYWLDGYATQIANVKKVNKAEKKLSSVNIDSYINKLKQKSGEPTSRGISQLLKTQWNQDIRFNSKCPAYPGGPDGKCYAGCVATAMAQIMKYWNYPEKGAGNNTYTVSIGTFSLDFSTVTFDWSKMTNTLDDNSTQDAIDAIGNLIYTCGVAVNMNYRPTGSSSTISYAYTAFRNYFKYRPTIKYAERKSYSDSAWKVMLMDNLDQKLPILYGGSGTEGGHAFVFDGYTTVSDTMFHINWGWSGAGKNPEHLNNKGYFTINKLDPIADKQYDFTNSQNAVMYITPYTDPYCSGQRVYYEKSREIEDGSNTSAYWNNSNCSWLINPPADSVGAKRTIALTFKSFATEQGKDILNVYDGKSASGKLLGSFSGHSLPPTLIAKSGQMYISFTSDSLKFDEGWTANYSTVTEGIDELDPENSMVIYPNPASTSLNLIVPTNLTGKVNLNIYNIIGKQVSSEYRNLNGNTDNVIDISSLKQGVYSLEILTDKYRIFKKFIKQ